MSDVNTEDYVNTKLKNTGAEISLLAYLCKKGFLEEANEDLFSSKVHRFIFKIIELHHTVNDNILYSEIEKHVRKEKQELYKDKVDLIFETSAASLSKKSINLILKDLIKLSESRAILVQADEMVNSVIDDDNDTAKKIARDISVMGKVNKKYGGEYLADYEERKEIIQNKIDNPNTVGVPTGIDKFDEKSGGLLFGEFGIIIGQSGIGKSVALENFAINAWLPHLNLNNKGHNVLYVSLEMTKHQLQFRADARLANILSSKFRTGKEFSKKDLSRWGKTIKELKGSTDNFFHIEYIPSGCTVEDVEILTERIQDKYKDEVHLVCIDYLNIMGSNKTWEFQAQIAWEIKDLCAEFNAGKGLAIWTANQLKAEAWEKEHLSLSDLKYGGAIGEVAQVVVGLNQPQHSFLTFEILLEILKFRDLKKIAPIALRPNMDIALLNDKELFESKTLKNVKRRHA